MGVFDYYNNKHVLITGTTGFVGKVILEKFLFMLSEGIQISLYILVRNKKGSSLIERTNKEIVESFCFERLRKREKNFEAWFFKNIKVIQGDLLKENLGLNQNDDQMLTENLNVIINCAASVDFNSRLDDAININILGTLRMFELSKKCKNIENFLHVSTAYVNSNLRGYINEEIYQINEDPEDYVAKLRTLSTDDIVKLTPKILKEFGYPNTYTFTKSLAERILYKSKGKHVITIVRPTIIGSSFKEPIQGWVDTISAAGAMYLLAGIGILKFIKGIHSNIGDQIPVDYVSNYVIVSAAALANDKSFNIFHVGSSEKNPATLGDLNKYIIDYFNENPPEKRVQNSISFEFIGNEYIYKAKLLKQKLPVILFLRLSTLFGSEMQKKALRYQKIISRSEMVDKSFHHFTLNQWIFSMKNQKILENFLINQKEKDFFFLNIEEIEWKEYTRHFGWGIQRFVLKENIDAPSNRLRKDVLSKTKLKNGYFSDINWAVMNGKAHNAFSKNKIMKNIMQSPNVLEAIQEEGIHGYKLANDYCNEMLSNYNMKVIKVFAFFIHKKIVIDFEKLTQLHELETKGPIVFVPNHMSYVDFLVLSYICYSFHIKCPYVHSTEDFLNISFFTRIFRASGGFFIKRTESHKKLFRVIIAEYLFQLIKEGGNLEMFIELSRTRSGKLTSASNEIFNIFLESYFESKFDTSQQITIVPVSINYERILEGETFPFELLGEEKVRESFTRIAKSVNVLLMNFGRVFVEFSKPIILHEFNKNIQLEYPSISNSKKSRKLVKQIMWDLNASSVIMPTNIIAAVLLSHRKGITETDLLHKSEWIAKELNLRNKKIATEVSGSSLIPIQSSIKLLDSYIARKKDMFGISITPKMEYKNILLLSYYRNGLINSLQREAKLACALVAFGHQLAWETGVKKERLKQEFDFLEKLLKKEFYDNEFYDFEVLLMKTQNLKVLKVDAENNVKVANEEMVTFLCFLIWPFVESYWITCVHLFTLRNIEKSVTDQNVIQRIQWFAESMYEERVLEFYESCSKDSIMHALQTFLKWKIIEKDNENNLKLIVSEKKLKDLENHLNKFLKNHFAKSFNSPIDIARKTMLIDFPFIPKL